jgi:hypothetical protein
MQRKLFAGVFLALLTLALPASAQTGGGVEYGQPEELRGVTRMFVETSLDTGRRDAIVKDLRKRLPQLEIVSTPEEADVHMRFEVKAAGGGKTEVLGSVFKVLGQGRVRVLYSYKDNTPDVFDGDPVLSYGVEYARPQVFARQFVKVYKKANS